MIVSSATCAGRDRRRGGNRDLLASLRGACRDGAVLRARGMARRAVAGVVSHAGRLSVTKRAVGHVGLSRDAVTVRHAHGAGCYGHNGADDAAVDAAVIAMQLPGHCVRVQWRREEEFGFEPVGTAHMTRIKAVLDPSGKPIDWTCEVWAGSHVQRPIFGGALLAHEAMPAKPPPPKPNDPAEAAGGGGTRNGTPLVRFSGEADHPSSGVDDTGADLVVTRARRAAERIRTGMFHRRAGGTGRGRSAGVAAGAVVRSARRGGCWRTWRNVAIGHRAVPEATGGGSASPGLVTKTARLTPLSR